MASYTFLGNPPPNIQEWIKKHHGPSLNSSLCFTAVDAGATIAFNKVGSPDAASIVYATESSGQRAALDWQPYTFNTVVTLANVGDKVYFRAADENDISFYKSYNAYYRFATTAGKRIAASGNIQTLMKADGQRLDISGKTYCYWSMFRGCISLTTAPSLPATTLANYCYTGMFRDCSSLATAPALPATTLADGCYSGMFYNCTSLTTAPSLPATTLAGGCYDSMFFNCPNVIEIIFANLTCEYVVEHALEWGLGIDAYYNKFLVVAYCSDGVVVINDNSGSSSDSGEGVIKVTYVDGTKKIFKIKGALTSSSIDNISSVKEVEIGSDVTSIGNKAFFNCSYLTSVTISDSVISIDTSAFEGCSGLTSVTIGNSVVSIGERVFYSCHNLTNVIIPDSVMSIGELAFCQCRSLTSMTIPDSVTSIGYDAFYQCSGLMSVTFVGKDLATVYDMANVSWGLPSGCVLYCTDGNTKV